VFWFSSSFPSTESLITMINLNNPDEQTNVWENAWKILIFDQHCSDIISPILRVGDLRKNGVTLHMYASNNRSFPSFFFLSSNSTKSTNHYLSG